MSYLDDPRLWPDATPTTAITLYPPQPGWRPSPEVARTVAWLDAEARDMERSNRAHLIDTGAARRARGEQIPPGSIFGRLTRKAARMVTDFPPPWEPGPWAPSAAEPPRDTPALPQRQPQPRPGYEFGWDGGGEPHLEAAP